MDLVNWERNILWSLNQYQRHLDMPLVLWDIIAALLAFKKSELDYFEKILVKWLISNLGFEWGPSLGIVSPHVYECLSNLTSRQLHLLNVINKHVILKNNINGEEPELWIKLLKMCERELRERVIGCRFSAILGRCNGNWQPVGLAQMRRWVENEPLVKDYVKRLASKMKKIEKRYVAEEECSYCSSTVPFEDTEVAFCQADNQKHKLARCAVSMILCPLSPSWFCVSCSRWVSNLAPDSLFTLLKYPPIVESKKRVHKSLQNANGEIMSKPQCPFCGVLLQRLQPEFLLATTPV